MIKRPFCPENTENLEEVQYENRYTREVFVYSLGRCGNLARNEHGDAGAKAQFIVRKMAREKLRTTGERPQARAKQFATHSQASSII